MAAATATIYKWVVDDVIAKLKPEFVQEGVDESLLDELRSLWESKMQAAGLLGPDPDHHPVPAAPAHAGHAVAPNPALAGAMMAARMAAFPGVQGNPLAAQLAAAAAAAAAAGRPGMPVFPPAALLGVKRPQPDGGFAAAGAPAPAQRQNIPQQDGGADGDDDEQGEEEDEEEGGSGAAEAKQEEEVNSDEVLSSDSDDDDEKDDDDYDDFLCCQFEKVARTKNRWKISMREGVFHIDGKDYLFKKAQGEWIF